MSPVKYAINVATCGGDGIAPAGGDGQVTVTEGEVEVLHVPACGGTRPVRGRAVRPPRERRVGIWLGGRRDLAPASLNRVAVHSDLDQYSESPGDGCPSCSS